MDIIQLLEKLRLHEDEINRTHVKQKAGADKILPESQKNNRNTKNTNFKKHKNNNPLAEAPTNPKHLVASISDDTSQSQKTRIRNTNGQTKQSKAKQNENEEGQTENIRKARNRPTFNRQWQIKPVETIVRLPRTLATIDPTKDCPICLEQFRSERVFRSHVAIAHGSGFKLDPLLDHDPRNRRIDRQAFKVVLEQLPMAVPTFSLTIENKASVTVLLNSVYIFDGNVQFLPVFAGEQQVLRMVPGYVFEEEASFDDLILVDGRRYSLIITATADTVFRRQIVEQYHFSEKQVKNRGKKTQLKLTKLPPYDIPRSIVLLYKSEFKKNDLYTDQEHNLLRLIEGSKQDDSLTLDRYSRQLTVLNQIEAQHLLQEYFSYTILEPVLVPEKNTRLYSVTTNQFKKKPSLLDEDVKVVFISQGNSSMKKAYGVIESISAKTVTFHMQEFVDEKSVAKVMFILNRTTFQLERNALQLMGSTLIRSICFPEAVVGGPLETIASFQWIRRSVASNEEQMVAIRNIVNQTSFPAPYILFGPPGTGKTSTLVEAIGQIHKLRPTVNILVAATSNFAANELASRLLDVIPDESIFRFFAFSCVRKIDEIDCDVLDVSNLAGKRYNNLCYEDIYMCRVVVATLTTAGRLVQANIKSKHFSYVFIDECGSSKEISSLIPIAGLATTGNEINASVVLAGDPKQLGPVMQYEFLKQTTHGLSMLERLMNLPLYSRDHVTKQYNPKAITLLRDNFRSHDTLMKFSSDLFYEGQLRAKASHDVKNLAIGWWRLPNRHCPLIFHSIIGQMKKDNLSHSFFNAAEAEQIIFYVSDLLTNGLNGKPVNQSDIGVLSFYARQVSFIKTLMRTKKWFDIEIGSAEQYQGREKAIMLISTVRSGKDNVGFLADAKRLNVALTRARSLLIVVGNAETLQQDPLWAKFVEYCRNHGAIVQKSNKKEKNTRNAMKKVKNDSSTTASKSRKIFAKNSNNSVKEPTKSSTLESPLNNQAELMIQKMIQDFYHLDFE
ncbi:putative helicase MOV-10 isoform X1 [Aedes albopictus]|uniref:RNA helicase n=1 Tax=Aedes albopictus TaxID=7160 RepID=A0ABM2A3I1_AEDAL|nr:putative helicase MOV-10 isoform X1 [Aedes albopictus]